MCKFETGEFVLSFFVGGTKSGVLQNKLERATSWFGESEHSDNVFIYDNECSYFCINISKKVDFNAID